MTYADTHVTFISQRALGHKTPLEALHDWHEKAPECFRARPPNFPRPDSFIELISATKTKTGLKVKGLLDTREYPKGVKISDEQMWGLKIKPHKLFPKWNYTITARS